MFPKIIYSSSFRLFSFAIGVVLGSFALCGTAHASSLRISGDFDYAAELSGREAGGGGGFGLRLGSQLDLVAATLIIEAGGSYHDFGEGGDDVGVGRGLVGGELRIGKILEPGIFAHVGVGHLSGYDAFTAPAVDVGLVLDLTLIPFVDVGAHVAYNSLLGSEDHDGFSWITAGLHAALVI